jgi:hypothetical protein
MKRSIWTKEWLKRRSVFWQGKLIICSCMWHFEKKMRMLWELVMNWWHGTAASKHVDTCFKLFHNLIVARLDSRLFENHQTVAQTVKPRHTRSDRLHIGVCCANRLTAYGAPHVWIIAFGFCETKNILMQHAQLFTIWEFLLCH